MCENRNRVTKLTSTHRSVDGKKLWLDITSYDTSNLCFEFTVKNVSVFFAGKKFVFIVFIIVSLLATLDIHNPNLYVVVVVIFIIGLLIAELLWSVNSG
jgi:hypothetical protein